MAACISLREEELLTEKDKENPSLSDKSAKGYKEEDVAINVWRKVAEAFEFTQNGK